MLNGRNTKSKFSGGNAERPKGSRNKAIIAIESLLEGGDTAERLNRLLPD